MTQDQVVGIAFDLDQAGRHPRGHQERENRMKTLLVFGEKTFKINIPDEAKITFGPWSPPNAAAKTYDRSDKALSGTLRVYESNKTGASVLAVFSGVSGYRDLSLGYAEEVAKEEGATLWKSDQHGYEREEKISSKRQWINDPQLTDGKKKRGKKAAEEVDF